MLHCEVIVLISLDPVGSSDTEGRPVCPYQ